MLKYLFLSLKKRFCFNFSVAKYYLVRVFFAFNAPVVGFEVSYDSFYILVQIESSKWGNEYTAFVFPGVKRRFAETFFYNEEENFSIIEIL